MRYAQKDSDMGAYNVSVEVDNEHTFHIVPETPNTFQVPLNTITFHCPNQGIPIIQNAPDNTIFRVEVIDPPVAAPNSLQVVQYPVEG